MSDCSTRAFETINKPELLPCPFCGYKSMLLCEDEGWSYVMCGHCLATSGYRKSIEEAVDDWNTRHERTCQMLPDGFGADGDGYLVYECSECGEGMCYPHDTEPSGYCCGCGAKVIGDSDD